MQPPHCVPHVAEAVAMNEMRRTLVICILDDMFVSQLAFCRVAQCRRERRGDRALMNYGLNITMRTPSAPTVVRGEFGLRLWIRETGLF